MKFPSPEIDPSPRPSCGTHLLGFGRPNSHYGPSEDAQTLRTTKPVTTFMIAAALGATCLSIFAYGRPQQQLCSRTYDAHVQCFRWTRRQWFQHTGVAFTDPDQSSCCLPPVIVMQPRAWRVVMSGGCGPCQRRKVRPQAHASLTPLLPSYS